MEIHIVLFSPDAFETAFWNSFLLAKLIGTNTVLRFHEILGIVNLYHLVI